MAGKANYLVRAKNGAVFVTSTLAEAKKVEASGAAPAKRRRNPAGSAKSDKAVIKAFTEQKAASGKSLHTDGVQLDGYWMGGNRLAYWSGDKIHLPDTGSVAGQKIQRAVVKETPRFWLADQHYLTGRRNPAGYYTVVIPPARYDQPDTEWHANRTVTRGAFSSKAKATAWAKEHLRGYPYSIKKIDLSRNPSAAEHLQRGAKRYGIAVKLRGKDLDAATRLAFSAESDLEDGGDHSGSEDAHALGLSLLRARRNPAGADSPAMTIARQLGGTGRLQAMLGTKKIWQYNNGNTLQFDYRASPASKYGNFCEITYVPGLDLYTVVFKHIGTARSGFAVKVIKEYDHVYADQLIDLFERTTGLYLTLAPRRNPYVAGEHVDPSKLKHNPKRRRK